MTSRELANIVLRLLGAVWCATVLFNAPHFFTFDWADLGTRHIAIGGVISSVLWLTIGAVVFAKSRRIASALFEDGSPLSISATAAELQQVGFSLLGIDFAVRAVATLGGLLYVFWKRDLLGAQFESGWTQYSERIITAALEAGFAILLFFGSAGLSKLWQRLRGRPLPDSTQ